MDLYPAHLSSRQPPGLSPISLQRFPCNASHLDGQRGPLCGGGGCLVGVGAGVKALGGELIAGWGREGDLLAIWEEGEGGSAKEVRTEQDWLLIT